MGLDMYLRKSPKFLDDPKRNEAVIDFVNWIRSGYDCTFRQWCEESSENLPDIQTIVKFIESFPSESFDEEVAYWRKVNAIHGWFVKNVQNDIDDCGQHRPVTKKDLEELRDLCSRVLANHSLAPELLPVTPGFFFGLYDYDDWYFEKLKYTVEICDRLLEETDFERYELYYHSSW